MKKYGLSARERIKHQKDLSKIFQFGKPILSSDKKLKAYYFKDNATQQPGVTFAVSVSKKLGNAVWRNRLKRLFREAYRSNKYKLIDRCVKENKGLNLIFSPFKLNQGNNKKLKLEDVEIGVREIIGIISSKI